MTGRPLRAVIVGLGKIGRLRHDLLARRSDWEVVAVADPAIDELDVPKGVAAHRDYRAALEADADVAFVCTPNHVTAAAVVAALDRGLHVFAEKPPGRSVAEVEAIRQAEARNPNRRLKFGFNHRYHDSVIEAKAIVQSGRLGELLWMRGVYGKAGGEGFVENWRSKRALAGGGILLDQGIHMLDLFRLFAGDFPEVQSCVGTHFWPIDVEDNAFALLRNERGQVGFLHSSATQWKHRFQLEIYLSGGYLAITGFNTSTRSYGREALVVAHNQFSSKAPFSPGNPHEETIYFERDDSWIREIEEFGRAIRAGTPVVSGTSLDALRVMELVERIYAADLRWKAPPAGPLPAAGSPELDVRRTSTPRRAVVADDARAEEIRPAGALRKYLDVVRDDATAFFRVLPRVEVPCPGCGVGLPEAAFEKNGFTYCTCHNCGTLYANPRPAAEALHQFEREAKSSALLQRNLLEATFENRRARVYRPRVAWMLDLAGPEPDRKLRYLDAGSGSAALLEELHASGRFEITAAEPRRDALAAIEALGIQLLPGTIANLAPMAPGMDIVGCFEVLERAFSPYETLRGAASVLKPGGLLALTTLNAGGFDVQALWDHSPYIFPPERLSLLSIEGLEALADRAGFDVVELSTPGQFDVEMVASALREKPETPVPRAIRSMVSRASSDSVRDFQQFLQVNRLSSHVRAALRKR